MTLNELKKLIDSNIEHGYGEFQVYAYDCEGGYSNDLVINIYDLNKEIDITS